MSGPVAQRQQMERLAAIVLRIPAGHVLTLDALALGLHLPDKLVATLLGMLSRSGGDVPWHRVVMPGGALGRHADRTEHVRRLKADGLAVAPAGIVQDMPRVALRSLAALPVKIADTQQVEPAAVPAPPPSRSRGRLGAPKSTV